MLSAYVQVTHQNIWGTVNHETGIKDMKCAPPVLFPKLEHTIPESPYHKLGADYAVSMVSEDGYVYYYSYWFVSVNEC